MDSEILKKLIKLYNTDDKQINACISHIKNNSNLENTISILNIDLARTAYYHLFVKNNLKEAKQYFFLSGRALEVEVKVVNKNLTSKIEYVTTLLLSDNLKLINRFSFLKHLTYDDDIKEWDNTVFCIQAIIRNDWEHLKKLLGYLKDKVENKRGFKSYQLDIDFFNAIAVGNEEVMKKSIIKLATTWNKKRFDHPLYNQLFSIPALTYAKLAYIKGYQLDIDHPLIPQELLPINPNTEYWEYDFMKEEQYRYE